MSVIELVDLKREFRQAQRFDGPFGAIRTLVTRNYTIRTALDDITFAIEPGESVAYLGPNGAGKSTTIKILTGILVPSSGHVRVLGNEPHRHRQRNAQRIGVVFGQRSQLWWDLPLLDSFDLHRRIYRIEPERFRHNLAFCEEVLRMEAFLHTPVRQLSLGQRMRGELAMALLHEPEVLFLDEPTIGLDVLAKDRIREFLKLVNRERGVTIMLTTHDLRDIEELCERILVVNLGKLVYDGRIDALRARLGSQRTIMIEFSDDPGAVAIPHASLVEDRGIRKTYSFDRAEMPALDLVSAAALAPDRRHLVRGARHRGDHPPPLSVDGGRPAGSGGNRHLDPRQGRDPVTGLSVAASSHADALHVIPSGAQRSRGISSPQRTTKRCLDFARHDVRRR